MSINYINNQQQSQRNQESQEITYGYSRPPSDLKQFILDLMCSGDGDIPIPESWRR